MLVSAASMYLVLGGERDLDREDDEDDEEHEEHDLELERRYPPS